MKNLSVPSTRAFPMQSTAEFVFEKDHRKTIQWALCAALSFVRKGSALIRIRDPSTAELHVTPLRLSALTETKK